MIAKENVNGQYQYLKAYLFTDYKQALDTLGKQYNVKFIYNVDDTFIDNSLVGQGLQNTATPISNYELARYSVLLPRLFSKYPQEVIKKELKIIKLSATLILYGVSYGGTSIDSVLYLTSAGIDNGYTDLYIKELFNHEFSSILMRNHHFPENEFVKNNPPQFHYAQNTDEILRSITQDKNSTGNEALYKNGFLTKYSMSTLENDLNMFAEHIFTKPHLLHHLINTYPRLNNKYLVVKEFYLGINPEFKKIFNTI